MIRPTRKDSSDAIQGLTGSFDPSVPNQARMYDYYLGGKDNYAADREAAGLAMQAVPQLRQLALENRKFLGRTVRFCAEAGIHQFIDIGAGLPTQENTHQVAQRAAPGSRVVYVDNDEVAVVHGRALLADNATTGVILGDLGRPGDILRDPELRQFIDLRRPVAILLLTILHFIPDEEDPFGIVAELRDTIAPGSYLVLSHAEVFPAHAGGTEPESEQVGMLRTAYRAAPLAPARGRAGILRLFDGFELVAPGLVEIWDWRPDDTPIVSSSDVMTMLGGVGRKA